MKNTLPPVQPNNGQPTLHEAIADLERRLYKKAAFLDGKRCSTDDHVHWKARGSQETLWEVARYLRAERRFHHSSLALHTALQDYLECLQTDQDDAEWDVARLPRPRRGMPIAKWKAEGEALVLSKICVQLDQILDEISHENSERDLPYDSADREPTCASGWLALSRAPTHHDAA